MIIVFPLIFAENLDSSATPPATIYFMPYFYRVVNSLQVRQRLNILAPLLIVGILDWFRLYTRALYSCSPERY